MFESVNLEQMLRDFVIISKFFKGMKEIKDECQPKINLVESKRGELVCVEVAILENTRKSPEW